MKHIVNIFFSIFTVAAITTRTQRHFQHSAPPIFTNWELGLREAVHQALLREHHKDPNLRAQLLEAPLIGRRDHASPFGDVAVLAKGQLYVTSDGYKFLQDADEDCDCYHGKCVNLAQCQLWKVLGHHYKLLALWTVKRIRHRDVRFGHYFEIEYTISPITSEINEDLVRRHGLINYNVPGHIFVVKSDPRLNLNEDKWYRKEHDYKSGILIGVTPDGYKHVLHSYPGFYSSYRPDQTTIDPKEYDLYKKLIDSLASKTSNVPHRFTVTTPRTTKLYVTTPIPQTTWQLVPLTQTILQKTTQPTKYSEPDLYYNVLQTTQMPTQYFTTEATSTDSFDIFTTKFVRKTTPEKTTPLEPLELFPVQRTTEPMQPSTEKPKFTTSAVAIQQLVPPQQTDTTFPYVVTTVTQPTTAKTTTVTKVPYTEVKTTEEKRFKDKTTVVYPVTKQQTLLETTSIGTTPFTSSYLPTTQTTEHTKSETAVSYTKPETTTYTKPETTSYTKPAITTTYIKPEITSYTKPAITTSYTKPTTTVSYTKPAITTTYSTPETTSYTKPITTTTFIKPSTSYTQPATTSYRKPETTAYTKPETTAYTKPETTAYTKPQTTSYTKPTITTLHTQPTETTSYTKPTTITTLYTKPTTIFEYSFVANTTPETTIKTLPPTTNEIQEKTTPITTTHYYYAVETEETKTTKTETTTPKKLSTTDDFLIEVHNETTDDNHRKEYNEDDIFGKAPPSSSTTEATKIIPTEQSDISEALFGGRRSKQLKISSKITTKPEVNTTEIIFSNFYTPATEMDYVPSTEQSLSTSISFKVNRKEKTVEPTVEARIQNVTGNSTKQVLDDAALRLINHARSIDYLQKKPQRQPKYKRRSYSTRRKVPRKSSNAKKTS